MPKTTSAGRPVSTAPDTLRSAVQGLRIAQVSKDYRNAGQDTLRVLDTLDLTIASGEFVSLVGASGCGKSTLLRLIAGLDLAYSGSITVDGTAVAGTDLARGLVFQDARLFPWLNVAQNIEVALRNAGLSAVQKRNTVAEHIALVGLNGFEQAYPHQLSGGMAQRVAIARGLVNRPRVLLLDEPFGALDALTRSRLQNELQRIWQHEKITMVLVTHDVEEAVFLSDRVIVMQPRPGRVQRIVEVPLARTRNRSDPTFIRIRDDVLRDFADHTLESVPQAGIADTALPFAHWRLAW
jgi:sulfonate transport system ATP-binding protein